LKRRSSQYSGAPNNHEMGSVNKENNKLGQKIPPKEISLKIGRPESTLAKTIRDAANATAPT